MTRLHRAVTRRTPALVIQIVPGDEAHKVPAMLRLREIRRRTWFEIPLGAVYVEAVRRAIASRKTRRRVRRGLLAIGRTS
jgi:hypothetical protein